MSTDIHDLLGAYCADALDPAERARFEEHLASCATCRVESAQFLEVLATVASAHAITPPAGLEDAVVAAATGTATVRPPGTPPVAANGTDGPASATGPATTGRIPRRGARPWQRGASWFAAAAAGALLFAGGWLAGSQRAPDQVAAEDGSMAAVVAVASAPDAHFLAVDIMGTQSRMVMSGEMDKSAFMASDLPMPAKGMCYQVWRVTADGAMESAGVFTPDPDGHVAIVLEGAASDVAKFMITIEPPGGSVHPTGDMLGEVRT